MLGQADCSGVVVEFELLGPVRAVCDGAPINVGVRKQRFVLAILALDANRMVPVDRLVDLIWPDRPPVTARSVIHGHISAIRGALARAGAARYAVALHREGSGYRLVCPSTLVDAHRFTDLVTQASAEPALAHRIAILDTALALWRGPALAGAAPEEVRARLCRRLEETRLTAMLSRLDALVQQGRYDETIHELTGLADEHPDVPRITELLMTALHSAGRSAAALQVYRDVKRRLVEELGMDPPAELQRMEVAILRDRARRRDDRHTAARPRELPGDMPHFTGRARALAQLDCWLVDDLGRGRGTVVISAIAGMGGVGKTALAVHWAHRVRDQFPDGQLYVNLRGFDPTGSVMPAADAIRRFLSALAVPAERIPTDPDSQVDLYRTLLADKRMLIVLDNARDCDQVRPLLPGAPGCVVIVTSRNMLTSLVAAEGAYPLSLDLLSRDEAHDLLSSRLGSAVAAQPEIVDDIVACCARLPLALVIVAARAITQPHLSLAAIASRLRDGDNRLSILSTSDTPATDLRAVLSWSYRALGGAAARLFALLGLHPGPDISLPATANLAGLSVETTESLLSDLARAHLIEQHAPKRYTFHDLLRIYAAELAQTALQDSERRAATHRMLDYYLHTAYAADRLLEPARETITLTSAEPGVAAEHFTDRSQALVWFTVEHAVLRAAVDHAASHDLPTHAWQLAWSLFDFFDRRGHWHDLLAVHQTAATATRHRTDPAIQILIHRILARANIQLGRFDDANSHLQHALTMTEAADDHTSRANIHNSIGHLLVTQGRHEEALKHALLAVDLFRIAGHRHGEANTLNGVGWCYAMTGQHQQALAYCQQALHLLQELDDLVGQAHTWDSLGYIHHRAGQHHQAVTCYEKAMGLARTLGARRNEAEHLAHLGDAQRANGNISMARTAWQHALAVLEQIDHPEADHVRQKLLSLD
jgi:DNA-binding SARP family transcriptional activator/tetratricopeptide (TPR) repeat protein